MINQNDRLNDMAERLNTLQFRQADLSVAIQKLKLEIESLKQVTAAEQVGMSEERQVENRSPITSPPNDLIEATPLPETSIQRIPLLTTPAPSALNPTKTTTQTTLEKFIGENLINKIGIAITIIGVSIGAKYSIEHDLIQPVTRIILGYLMAAALLGFGIKLKKNYESYSAVLVSGSIAIMYFITYAAYSFYGFLSQPLAFFMMLLFTAFGVATAIKYNKQVIAHIGLVGAYAVPFLLSEGSGRIAILFSYMAIINAGILIIAFKKYWKSLYYSAFLLTWLIFVSWFNNRYEPVVHFKLSLLFACIFFAIFYAVFLAYKLIKKEKFDGLDIILVVTNAFIFYGMGYSILISTTASENCTGLFTLFNAILHALISLVLYKQKNIDRNLFYLATGLSLVFLTITFPVQFNGNWVTLSWVGEAAVLFWIGRTKNVSFYETLSYPLMALSFLSLMQDWTGYYDSYAFEIAPATFTPLLNINFISSFLFTAAFGFINYINIRHSATQKQPFSPGGIFGISIAIPAILILAIYCSFYLEIDIFWRRLFYISFIAGSKNAASKFDSDGIYNNDLQLFKTVWLIIYSLAFASILSIINMRKIKSNLLAIVNLLLNAIVLAVFLTKGLFILSELRNSCLYQSQIRFYPKTSFNISIRYVAYVFSIFLLVINNLYTRQPFIETSKQNFLKITFDLLLHTTILWMASSEFINILSLLQSGQSYKLGLSILWGLYALLLVVAGIWKNKVYLRISAIVLFGVTLLKLFFYDIADMNTITKTIVFVSLGILLLIISFLYNKYKASMINDKDQVSLSTEPDQTLA